MTIILNWHNWNAYIGQFTLGKVVIVVGTVKTDLFPTDPLRFFSLKENKDFLVSIFSFLSFMII